MAEIAKQLGLKVERMVVNVTEPQMFTFAFSVSAEAVMTATQKEQKKFDKDFADIERAFQEETFRNEKLPSARKDIEDWLKDLE